MEVWQYNYIMETQKFNKTLLGNVALVTGGSRGVGLSIALELAKRGCDICFTYLKDHNSAKIAHEQLLKSGNKIIKIRNHMGDPESINKVIDIIKKEFGELNFLINNAASGVMKNSSELSIHHWDWTMNINARGPWLITKEISKIMPSGGRVINISSPGSKRVLPSYFAVGVSKSALETITKYMSIEMSEKGISVNAVSPGFIKTKALNAFPEDLSIQELANRNTPAGRSVTGKDVGNVVSMLCGKDAEMIRGQIITVDGGETILFR